MAKDKDSESSSHIGLRDGILIKQLVPGACTFKYLWDEIGFHFTTEHALRQRLAQLAKSEYIQSKLYDNHSDGPKFALYVVGPAGIAYLTENAYTADEIRTLLPSQHTVAHELVVTDIVRTLQAESMQMEFPLKYYDDPACRSQRKLLGLKAPVPDLLLELKWKNAPLTHRVNIEVHMGTVPLLEVVDKALKQEWQTLFICNTTENMDKLWKAMANRPELKSMVYFTLISEFCTKPGGIFGSNYMALNGRRVSLYPY